MQVPKQDNRTIETTRNILTASLLMEGCRCKEKMTFAIPANTCVKFTHTRTKNQKSLKTRARTHLKAGNGNGNSLAVRVRNGDLDLLHTGLLSLRSSVTVQLNS